MLTTIGLPDAVLLARTGDAVVFGGLAILMLVVTLIGKVFSIKKKEAAAPAPVEAQVVEEKEVPLAPGTAGELKLYDTNPKTAAMLMAIVADKMGKPLNELRFISIKEVK